jgi:hypothetical protein
MCLDFPAPDVRPLAADYVAQLLLEGVAYNDAICTAATFYKIRRSALRLYLCLYGCADTASQNKAVA